MIKKTKSGYVVKSEKTGAVMVAVGAIMDLQAAVMDMNEHVIALEKKESKDGNESSQGS